MIDTNKKLDFTGERLTTVLHNNTMLEHLHRYAIAMDYVTGKVVLDVASGEGYGTNLLSKKANKIYGVDISSEAIKFSREKYKNDNITFIQAEAINIPLPDQNIDVIVCFETIEHHDKHNEMLTEFKRILKPDGILIISSPDKLYYSDIPKFYNSFHVKELYKHEFETLIKSYFKETQLLYQKAFQASLVTSDKLIGEAIIFKGSYENIENIGTNAYIYNIAIASDKLLPTVQPSSFFESDGTAEENNHKDLIALFTNSTTWRVGKTVIAPAMFLKKAVSFVLKKIVCCL